MDPVFFESPTAWRKWLAANHNKEDELWVGFHKRATGRPSLTWPESVDEALCFGWIDGLRKRIDGERYKIRFTRRRSGSIWSAVNVKRVAELTKNRRMRAAGSRAFKQRTDAKTAVYSFEQRKDPKLPPALLKEFKANAGAWRFFSALPPGYQRMMTWWVISAKKEETQLLRLAKLIDDSAKERRIDPMKPSVVESRRIIVS